MPGGGQRGAHVPGPGREMALRVRVSRGAGTRRGRGYAEGCPAKPAGRVGRLTAPTAPSVPAARSAAEGLGQLLLGHVRAALDPALLRLVVELVAGRALGAGVRALA